ncbi:MAG: hypothetical protein AB1898_02350 [Acidobacteriota bacterium]
MRYLVSARIKNGKRRALAKAIEQKTLGLGSVAGGEYLRNMESARLLADGTARWVEVCFCPQPLQEERPYWEEFFDLLQIKNAHDRNRCRDVNGEEPWACCECDCTKKLEDKLRGKGQEFLNSLKKSLESRES